MQDAPKQYAALFSAIEALIEAHKSCQQDVERGQRVSPRSVQKVANTVGSIRDEYEKLSGAQSD